MDWIAALQKAIVYMEAHLLEEINYEDVARQVHISGYEFHRAFSFLAGMTANTYIRNRRLSLAGRDVAETAERITNIALKYGYETPESFSKAFTRFHGVSPKAVRETSAKLRLFNPLAIIITVEGGMGMDYRIVHTGAQKFLALTRSFSNEIINDDDNHDVADFWGECYAQQLVEPLRNLRPAGKRDLYGLCSPARDGEDSFLYGIGILVDEETAAGVPEAIAQAGYTVWDVEPGTYAVFDCIGKNGDCITETWSRFYKEFLPQMGYEAAEATDYELYPEQKRGDLFCELWIPVRKK